ncbi:MAG: hypothetical protein KAQ92_00310, partial [Candidatus Aenigmarchaeota archaeon]|nr:hypothetical protein [Candidatus Aenigmarchaeota archaeon]
KKRFVVEYNHSDDSLIFFYSDIKDTSELSADREDINYTISKKKRSGILIKNLSDFLGKKKEIIAEKCLINNNEKDLINFYLHELERYEDGENEEPTGAELQGISIDKKIHFATSDGVLNPSRNKDKVREAKTYLTHIKNEFPLIDESYICNIRELLKDTNCPKLEECAEIIMRLERKRIQLSSLATKKNIDKKEEYEEKYESEREYLTDVFDSEMRKLLKKEEPKIIKVRTKIARVRKILEIRCRNIPAEEKQKIEQYIKVIQSFEIEPKKEFDNTKDKISSFRSLLYVIQCIDVASTLMTGFPPIIASIVKLIKDILDINLDIYELKNKYNDEKEAIKSHKEINYEEKTEQKKQNHFTRTVPNKKVKTQRQDKVYIPPETNVEKVEEILLEEIKRGCRRGCIIYLSHRKKERPRCCMTISQIYFLARNITKEKIQNAVQSNKFGFVKRETKIITKYRREYFRICKHYYIKKINKNS